MHLEKDRWSWPTNLKLDTSKHYLLATCLSKTFKEFEKNLTEWKRLQDFEELDYESLRMIPRLSRLVEQFQVVDENQPRYQGIYKKSWVLNLSYVSEVRNVFSELQQKKLPFIVKGNLSFANHYYKEIGVLKSTGTEIVVRRKDVLRVLTLLEKNAYFAKGRFSRFSSIRILAGGRVHFVGKTGCSIQVSLHCFPFHTVVSSETMLKNNTQTVEWKDLKVQILTPELELVRLLLLGISGQRTPQLQWVMDIHFLLEKEGGRFDWNLFKELTKQHDMQLLAGISLEYLATLGVPTIPEKLVNDLKSRPTFFNRVVFKPIRSRTKLGVILRFVIVLKHTIFSR